ncbi:MAG TPA: ATP-binding protein [Candidatus Eisenbacteria bacterium]|nr:ATP-binding protein [Candidatus Eisenbacteria bacterium]
MSLSARILRALGDPVIAVDSSGDVILWTPAAERLLGFPVDEVLGRPLPEVGVRVDTLLPGRERRITMRRREGGQFPAMVTATALHGPDGELMGAVLVVKDLTPWIGPGGDEAAGTEAMIVEERLGAAFRGIVEATGADLDRGGRLEPLAQSLAEHGRRLLPGISCLIAVVPATRQEVFYCLAGAGPFAQTIVNQTFRRDETVLGTALTEKRVVERSDMQQASGHRDRLIAAGMHTMRAVPMTTDEPLPDGRRSLGAIAYYRAEPRPFSESERRLLDDYGALVSLSLQRAELRATTERTMARLQLAVDVALDLARSLDVGEVVKRLVRRAAVATSADRCTLLRLEGGQDGEMVIVDAYDASGYDGGIGYRQPVSAQPLVREAVASRRSVLRGQQNVAPLPAGLRRALGDVRWTATVPLVFGGEVIAVLVLSRRRDPPFGQEEVDTLTLLGGPAALALRNSYLYARTEEASRVKTDFLDMAAHELRTPLTVISGYLSILREGAFGPAPQRWNDPLRILDAKAVELRRLVDDLLLAARLETGRLDSSMQPVDLREVAEQSAQGAEHVPELALPQDPVVVRGDREHLGRLLDQLVNNALSYTGDGGQRWARIDLEVRPEEGEARLAVEDRGRGLPGDQEVRIFERFYRYEDPDHPMVPGTGLGLYIARELAGRHGGRVELEWSQRGLGSRFALFLPLLEGRTAPEPDEDAAEAAEELTSV